MPFYANFKGRYGMEASPYSIQGYDGVLMAVNAIKLAGSLDKAKIRDALENEKNVLTVWGYRSFSSLDTGHAMPVELCMIQIVNGNRYPIWPLALAKSANVTYTPTYPPYPWSP
jgi:branched-chain amino acid transport system substrate-binding protein